MLRKRIEKLPDNHPVKPQCLLYLAHLYGINGNPKEDVLLLRHVLKLERERGDDNKVARVLGDLSRSNLLLGSREEGIDQVREAMEIYERLGQTMGRARCLHTLAGLLWADGQLDAAKEAIFEAFELLPEKGEEPDVCMSHKILGDIYHSQGEIEKAVYHFKLALGITFSPRNRYCSAYSLYMIHSALAWIFLDVGRLNDAQFHNEQAKSLSLNDSHQLARAVLVQALIYRDQRRLEAAASEALRAQGIFEKLGSLKAVEDCKTLLQNIEDLKPCFQILEFLKLLVQCLKNFKLLREIEEATESLTPSDESDTNAPGASSSTPHDHSPAGFQS
ncbi:hypothetical protein BJ322DRAFT_1016901 [Thelephora terrestris]|uniref:MalT-like TPR region domain-containing protein n=1 Tax=Thelephora terrestris TaxID=56493 RepID=A0A9P6HRG6_9AGAM|nr:hypothetical protein BJ322DRAFT_1016901 [Thelephora terrestris]